MFGDTKEKDGVKIEIYLKYSRIGMEFGFQGKSWDDP